MFTQSLRDFFFTHARRHLVSLFFLILLMKVIFSHLAFIKKRWPWVCIISLFPVVKSSTFVYLILANKSVIKFKIYVIISNCYLPKVPYLCISNIHLMFSDNVFRSSIYCCANIWTNYHFVAHQFIIVVSHENQSVVGVLFRSRR